MKTTIMGRPRQGAARFGKGGRLLFLPLLLILAVAPPALAEANNPFDPGHVLEVHITMAPEDWQALRISHRDTSEGFSQVAQNPYEYYPATAVVDGQTFESVGVRKKGFFGSAISTRPSLKIKLDDVLVEQKYDGLGTLTFNNNNQDPSRMQSVLVYRFMNAAGVNSPRANFARVSVNGEDMGVYTHVESVNKTLMRRLFGSAKGDLWEGYAGDFTEADFNRIVHKDGKDEAGEHLQELYELLQQPDAVDLEALGKLIDIDAFLTLWASEVLIGHWDGYASNRNNYYIYRKPGSGLSYFIPWGPDSAFWDPGPFLSDSLPKSFKARGRLCQRLWELPEIRDRYRAEMQRLLNEVWDERAMLADMERFESLIAPFSTASAGSVQRSMESIRQFIQNRRGDVQAELNVAAVDWPKPGSESHDGPTATMEVTGRFSTVYQVPEADTASSHNKDPLNLFANVSHDLLGTGEAGIEITVDGDTRKPFTHYGVRVTPGDPEFIRKGYPVVELIATPDSGHPAWRLQLIIDPYQVNEGENTLPIDHFTVWALLTQGEPGSGEEQTRAFGINGSLELDHFSRESGARVSGRFRFETDAFENLAGETGAAH